MDAVVITVVAIFGLMVGSFLNVVIYRVPRRESIVLPSSHCPACEHPLSITDNIPLISWLLLGGKCRYCGERISIQYPLIEAVTMIAVVILYVSFGLTFAFGASVFFFLVLLTVSAIDIEYKIIPNVIILPALALSVSFLPISEFAKVGWMPFVDHSNWVFSAIGFLAGGGFLFLLALIRPDGMGGGDIKLAAFMGLFLGRYVIVALFIGFLFGSIGGLAAMTFLKKSRKDLIPFGPYLAAGAVFTWFLGVPLVNWYLSTAGMV
ncbi:MAG TPA: prepilin peptidase [Actinobacteria bacterium]|nr:prepilin peptidase [Actinomycetota bacterium]